MYFTDHPVTRRGFCKAAGLFSAAALAMMGTGCANSAPAADNDKPNVVATIFPQYDFLRQIGGSHINLTMLLTPGAESHSFEPTPQNMITVQDAALFVYVGGDSDAWVDKILSATDTSAMKIVTLMDCVSLVEEETVAGMTAEAETGAAGETEYDEHVWTSPKNAALIVQKLCDALCEIDSAHAADYRANAEAYQKQLDALDADFREIVGGAARTEIVVGDRFPFRYFVEEYGLTYYAAFPGCATETECSAATIAFLTDKVKSDGIPVVFHIELSNRKVCDSICEATGAKPKLLHAVHNISRDDFDAGATYLTLMEQDADVLREALN